jgi:hypothetical protein
MTCPDGGESESTAPDPNNIHPFSGMAKESGIASVTKAAKITENKECGLENGEKSVIIAYLTF